MGKDSLIKSTAKKSAKKKTKKEEKVKKTAAKKKTTKKEAPKKSAKPVSKAKKTTAKKKSPAKATAKKKATAVKSTSKPKTKAAAKSKTKPSPKRVAKKATKKTTKKLSAKELLLKTFDPISKVAKPKAMAPEKRSWPSAPPIVNVSDPKEKARLHKLLFQSYRMADIKAAAKAPADGGQEISPAHAEPAEKKVTQKSIGPESPAEPPPSKGVIDAGFPPEPEPAPLSKTVKILAACAGVVVLLLLMTSYTNSSKFYIEPKDNAIEILKGRFSPKDKRFFIVLHGTQLLGKAKEVYSREEVYPMIFEYYLGKADTLLEVPGLPDFEGIKTYLHDAKKYALAPDKHKRVADRLNNIDRMILLYKADVSISQGTLKSLDAAVKHLKSALSLITNDAQKQEIQQKLDLASSLKAALKAKADKNTK